MNEAGVRSAWDRFWRYDRLSSFGTGPGAANYAAPIADSWRHFFASCPDGARVLDLCTGNGAIAVLAMESAAEAGKEFTVTGADLADVRPAAFVSRNARELAHIRFLPNTPAEQLPLSVASFDVVVSQYGIEYSDMGRSVPEAARVLAPGGRLRFATHAAEGSVARDTRLSIADADFLLDEIDLIGRASQCFEAVLGVERSPQADPAATIVAKARLASFIEGLRATEKRMASAMDRAMLSSVHQDLIDNYERRQTLSLEELVAKASRLRTEVVDHRERQRALLAAALSSGQLEDMMGVLKDVGLSDLVLGEQRDGRTLIGHVIEARRPA